MVTEEIHLNEALEKAGCEVIETDLGEYILQLDDHDPPSHIVVPALHKNKEQIRDTFKEKRGTTKLSCLKSLPCLQENSCGRISLAQILELQDATSP